MLKCILIYLWIYTGLFSMTEAGDDDEHVHIKLHMPSGQRKRSKIQQHTQHHKKRHSASQPPPPESHHHHHQQHSHPQPSPGTTNLYNESPHNYLTGLTTTSFEPQQHLFQHTKKYPSLSPQHLHESGQLLNMDEEVVGGSGGVSDVDADAGEPIMIPSYLAKNFALFPQPTTTYKTEIIPHNSEGFNVADQGLDVLEDLDEDNEITHLAGRGAGSLQSLMLAEQMENYQRYKPSTSSSSANAIKNEQLLQQLLQQQHNKKPEIMNAAAYKLENLQENNYRAEKDYRSEDDMTEAMMYSSSAMDTRNKQAHNFKRPLEDASYSGSIKALTVDDIWSQLQQQYLSKYAPQAQPLIGVDSEEQTFTATTTTKTKPKRKRNTKRNRHAKPTTATYSTSWPAKTLNYGSSNQHKHQKQQHHYYSDDDDIRSSATASAFGSSSLSSHRDTDLFGKRPFNKFTAHHDDDTEDDNGAEGEEDDVDIFGDNADDSHDETYEEAVYQRGKKFAGHTAYGQHSHTHNPFNYHDLYGSYSTPVTATVATNLQPSTYHPNRFSSTLPSYAASSTSSFLPTIPSHPSTSYQWRTQQNYPASYQSYLLQHQQQQPQPWTATGAEGEQYAQLQQQSAALRLPKATITQTANTISSSKLPPTSSNDFTASSSYSSSAKSTAQTPARYKKRKNRIKTKRNRIVVI